MASPYQQQALRRKLIYLGLIVVLLTASCAFRTNWIVPQADRLALREQSLGDVELTGSAVRLSLTGSRGLAVCILWMNAIEKQKKNQWEEFELLANSVTKLQPHYIIPWQFQSWNLAYNISVRCDSTRDMYFYISRGCEMLAVGERLNQHHPDLRYNMGIYYQSKICQADRKQTLQSLFQMSSVPPSKRSRDRFWKYDSQGRRTLDQRALEDFCKANPRLVRRLYEKVLRPATPDELVKFLEVNYRVPSVYKEPRPGQPDGQPDEKRPETERFPILPPARDAARRPQMFDDTDPTVQTELDDSFDAFLAARAWFGYAQEPLPPPDEYVAGESAPVTDRTRQRLPRRPATIIFRASPARAQSYVAERMEDEGWFDSGWKVVGWFPGDRFENGDEAVIGQDKTWAAPAWEKAHDMWRTYGQANNMLLSLSELTDLQNRGKKFGQFFGLRVGQLGPALRPEQRGVPEWEESKRAWDRLFGHDYTRRLTNFPHFYFRSQVEMKRETVAARRILHEADRLAGRQRGLDLYEEGFDKWRAVLDQNQDFRSDNDIQEETFEMQFRYLQLFNDTPLGRLLKRQTLAQGLMGQTAGGGLSGAGWLSLAQVLRPQAVGEPRIEGPFDRNGPDGKPYIPDGVRSAVLGRKGIIAQPSGTPPDMERMRQMMSSPPVRQ